MKKFNMTLEQANEMKELFDGDKFYDTLKGELIVIEDSVLSTDCSTIKNEDITCLLSVSEGMFSLLESIAGYIVNKKKTPFTAEMMERVEQADRKILQMITVTSVLFSFSPVIDLDTGEHYVLVNYYKPHTEKNEALYKATLELIKQVDNAVYVHQKGRLTIKKPKKKVVKK